MIVPSEKLKKSLGQAASIYHQQLRQDDEAIKYLTEERRFSKEAIAHFGLGVVREPLDGHDTYRDRISFPYYTSTGITSIRFRYLGDNRPEKVPKFLSLTGDSARLYNVAALKGSSKVFICEGETDTITAWMAGVPAVGIPGATSWKPAFSRVFRNREVVVLADNDDNGEGKKFADHIYKSLEGVDIVMMPRGYDVSSFVAENGLSALREKVGM